MKTMQAMIVSVMFPTSVNVPLNLIRQFAVLRAVETCMLLFGPHAKSDRDIDDLENNQRHTARIDDGGADRDCLRPELSGVTKERSIASRGIDAHGGKETCCVRSPYTADPLDVVLFFRFVHLLYCLH